MRDRRSARRLRLTPPALVFCLGATAACTGSIGTMDPGSETAPDDRPGTPGAPSTSKPGSPGAPPAPGTPPAAGDPTEAGPSPLRRLTRREYNNTVRDLLGDTSRPADQFPLDRE